MTDPCECDGLTEIYLGEHQTNRLARGGQVRRGRAWIDSNILHITDLHDDGGFSLHIPLIQNVKDDCHVELKGKFPWGTGQALKCHAKHDLRHGFVRVGSFDDPDMWFEAHIAVPSQSSMC